MFTAMRMLKYLIEGIIILKSEYLDPWWKWYYPPPPSGVLRIVSESYTIKEADDLYKFKVWYIYSNIQLEEKINRYQQIERKLQQQKLKSTV
jgi:hypothetical protein